MPESFHDQDLTGADFANADLTAATFERCTLSGANFRHADLSEALFSGCRAFPAEEDAEPVDFSYATLREARFERCDLTTALFCHASAYELALDQCKEKPQSQDGRCATQQAGHGGQHLRGPNKDPDQSPTNNGERQEHSDEYAPLITLPLAARICWPAPLRVHGMRLFVA